MAVALLVGTDKGGVIVRSDDRSNWEVGPLEFKGWRVTSATRAESGRFYVGVALESFGNAILVSDDLVTFEQLPSAPRYGPDDKANPEHQNLTSSNVSFSDEDFGDRRFVDQIWTLHAAGNAIFAGVSEAGVFRSDDGGKTFERKVNGVPPGEGGGVCVHSLKHPSSDPNRIYGQFHDGFFRTTDGGDTWERAQDGLPESTMTFVEGATFGFATAYDDRTNSLFSFPLAGDDYRYPFDGQVRVYRSTDGATTWHPLDKGMPTEPRFGSVLRGAMATDGLDPAGVYVGTTSGQVYVSPDLGESWSELPVTLPRVLCVEAFEL